MTYEKAIRILESKAIEATGTLNSLPPSVRNESYLKRDIKAFDIAILAVDKQRAEKPFEVNEKVAYITWKCPICGKRHTTVEKVNHCDNCGKKIDWTEGEE